MDKPRMLKPFTLNYYDRVINLPKIISIILTVMLGTGILISIALVVTKSPSKASPAVIALVIFSAIFYVANKMGYHKLVAMGTFLITSAVMTYNSVYDNGIYDVALIAFPVVIVLASLLLGYRFVWPIILVVLIMLAGIYQLSLSGFTTPYHGLVTTQTQDFWTVVTAMVVTGILVYIIMSIIERNVNQILSSEQQLQRAYESTLRGWARALELRDQETEGHSQRVTHMTLKLAKKMGIPEGELKFIRWGSLLHDIGKMAIPDTILLKKENLNEDELEIVRRHPEIAKQLLQEIPYLERAIVIPYYHHERWDGSGFPNGLKGKEIPLPARIFAVVDVWDALISERSYKEAWPIAKAKEYLSEQSGKLFDPVIVEAFLEFINTTPPKTS